MDILAKIQNQPKHVRKMIFWLVIIVVSVVMTASWISTSKKRLEGFKKEDLMEKFNPPQFDGLQDLPKLETPTP